MASRYWLFLLKLKDLELIYFTKPFVYIISIVGNRPYFVKGLTNWKDIVHFYKSLIPPGTLPIIYEKLIFFPFCIVYVFILFLLALLFHNDFFLLLFSSFFFYFFISLPQVALPPLFSLCYFFIFLFYYATFLRSTPDSYPLPSNIYIIYQYLQLSSNTAPFF